MILYAHACMCKYTGIDGDKLRKSRWRGHMTNVVSDKSKLTLLTLRNKLIFGFAVPIVLIMLIAVLTVRSNNNVGTEVDKVVNQIIPVLTALENLRLAGMTIISSTNEGLLLHTLHVEADEQAHRREETQVYMAQSQFRGAVAGIAHFILEQDLNDV